MELVNSCNAVQSGQSPMFGGIYRLYFLGRRISQADFFLELHFNHEDGGYFLPQNARLSPNFIIYCNLTRRPYSSLSPMREHQILHSS
jgi:hypothetical protein